MFQNSLYRHGDLCTRHFLFGSMPKKSVEEAVNGGVDRAVDSDCFTFPAPSGRDATMLCLARKRKEENAPYANAAHATPKIGLPSTDT